MEITTVWPLCWHACEVVCANELGHGTGMAVILLCVAVDELVLTYCLTSGLCSMSAILAEWSLERNATVVIFLSLCEPSQDILPCQVNKRILHSS